jgi:regulatory protein
MSVITAIVPSTRSQGRFVIEVDGSPAATVSLETIERLHLRTGAPFEPARDAVERDATILRVYDRALNMLAARGRAERELRRLLVRKGEPADVVDLAIERLLRAGLLNDDAYARAVARAKAVGQGHSKRRVRQELFRRGVDRAVADDAIEETFAEEGVDEDALVEQAVRKKMRSLAALDPAVRDRRLYAFLARRGFDGDAIRRAMKRVTGVEAPGALDATGPDLDAEE